MATYRDGNVRRATPNSVTSAIRSAKSRQCPRCGRKSALTLHADDFCFGNYCRWNDCGYENLTVRKFEDDSEVSS